ncbi:MAG: hypothetical protein ABSH15_07240 [Verrucomicrobiota bacterium]
MIALEISKPRWFNPAGFFVGVQALACLGDTLKRELQRDAIFSSAFLHPSGKRKTE